MDTWIKMRPAYVRYAEAVPRPILFDSFRRWVTQGRIKSRKRGRFKEIHSGDLDRLISKESSVESFVEVAISSVLEGFGGDILIFVAPEEEPEVFNLQPFLMGRVESLWHVFDLLKEEKTEAETKVGDNEFIVKAMTHTAVVIEKKHEELLSKIDESVGIAKTTAILEHLVRKGEIKRMVDDGVRKYEVAK